MPTIGRAGWIVDTDAHQGDGTAEEAVGSRRPPHARMAPLCLKGQQE